MELVRFINVGRRVRGKYCHYTKVRSMKLSMHKLAWLCPFLMAAIAILLLMLLEISIWTLILAAILLACPLSVLYSWIKIYRWHAEIFSGPLKHDRGFRPRPEDDSHSEEK